MAAELENYLKPLLVGKDPTRIDGGLSLPGMPEWSAPCQWMNPEWTENNRRQVLGD